ncbi:MAG: hypothetical protein IJ233_03180 [Pyramidobacter sp.]|nr:hypothetical protein [Pyramidobacter sp.]
MSSNNKKALSSSWAIAFTVASVWFGTHVGGGFATGNQVIGYFAQYGQITSLIFPLLAMGLLAIVMHIWLKFARLNGFDNYKDTVSALYPSPKFEFLFEIFYIVIILAAVAAAVAGAGEVLANFLGVPYVGATKVLFNLIVVALLVVLSIFGVKLVAAASTVLSVAIMIISGLMILFGLLKANMINDLFQQFAVDPASYTTGSAVLANAFAEDGAKVATVYSSWPLNSMWRGILVYAAFQCVSIPPMIAAAKDMTHKGTTRACILGWLMNGLALGLSGFTLAKWYPLLMGLQKAEVDGFLNATGIPNQTMLTLMGIKWLLYIFSILLFCAFVSTCVTLVFTMVQRFSPKLVKVDDAGNHVRGIKNETVRRVIVAIVAIAVCFAISLLGLTNITKLLYGYDGYYALVVVVLPAFIWGIPKIKKLEAAQKQ